MRLEETHFPVSVRESVLETECKTRKTHPILQKKNPALCVKVSKQSEQSPLHHLRKAMAAGILFPMVVQKTR